MARRKRGIIVWDDDDVVISDLTTALASHFSDERYAVLVTKDVQEINEFRERRDIKMQLFVYDVLHGVDDFGITLFDEIYNVSRGVAHIFYTNLSKDDVNLRLRRVVEKYGVKEPYTGYVRKNEGVVTLIAEMKHLLRNTAEIIRPVTCDTQIASRLVSGLDGYPGMQTVLRSVDYSAQLIREMSVQFTDEFQEFGGNNGRLCGMVVGSVGRLEASSVSDVDYFVLFDDAGMDPTGPEFASLRDTAYVAVSRIRDWLIDRGIEVDFSREDSSKTPHRIDYCKDFFPTYFPLSWLNVSGDGADCEAARWLRRQCFLVEGAPFFNSELYDSVVVDHVADKYSFDISGLSRAQLQSQTLFPRLMQWYREIDISSVGALNRLKSVYLRRMSVLATLLAAIPVRADGDGVGECAVSDWKQLLALPTGAKLAYFARCIPVMCKTSEEADSILAAIEEVFDGYSMGLSTLAEGENRAALESGKNEQIKDALQEGVVSVRDATNRLLRVLPAKLKRFVLDDL